MSATVGEDVSATAEEGELSWACSGLNGEYFCSIVSRVRKMLDLRRLPLATLPNNVLSNQSAFLSILTKDKGPPAESISLTSKPKGLVRLPPSIDHCFDN